MPRPPRVHVEGALHLVTSRALPGLQLFRDDRDYAAYLDLLKGYQTRYGFTLLAFVLLPDQLSLCIELANETTISDVMHALNSRYTKLYNKRYGYAGHLFQERFKSALMEKETSLLPATGYLHLLPVQEGIVKAATEWRWSSLSVGIAGDVVEMTPDAWRMFDQQVRNGVVGSEPFAELVRQRRKAAAQRTSQVPDVVPALAGSAPQPKPRPFWQASSFPVTLTAVCSMLVIAGLYGRNLMAMRQTMRAVAKEHAALQLFASLPMGAAETHEAQGARLATFVMPSRLSGTRWTIQVRPVDGSGAVQQDTLEFQHGTVSSQQFGAQGFEPSNYTLSHQPDGSVVWETMQTNDRHEVVCWRGEWNGTAMRGVVTYQRAGETPDEFSFIGTSPSGNSET